MRRPKKNIAKDIRQQVAVKVGNNPKIKKPE